VADVFSQLIFCPPKGLVTEPGDKFLVSLAENRNKKMFFLIFWHEIVSV